MRDLIWKRADQGMKTWIKAKDLQTKTAKDAFPVQNTISTASVHCAGRDNGSIGQEPETVQKEPATVKNDMCDKKEQKGLIVKDKAYYQNRKRKATTTIEACDKNEDTDASKIQEK